MIKVTKFIVKKLHDVFDYELDFSKNASSGTTILYGDNGSGKTTLLKLLFHILSPSEKKGHLTAIARIPFSMAEVVLSDGTKIKAERGENAVGIALNFSVTRNETIIATYFFVPESEKSKIIQDFLGGKADKFYSQRNKQGKGPKISLPSAQEIVETLVNGWGDVAYKKYLSSLSEIGAAVYFLGTDRHILSDSIDVIPSTGSRGRDPDSGVDEQIAKLRTAYLKDALQRGGRYLNRQIITASNVGSKNINDIYSDIFRRILTQNEVESNIAASDMHSLMVQLRWLQRRQRKFVKLGLSPELDLTSFMPDISKLPKANIDVLSKVLTPFIATLRARLDAMDPIRAAVQKFLYNLNQFLRFKTIEYLPASGFRILGAANEPIDVDQLSSGEQQLLLMFCSVLAASDGPNIFIIDEPEISLNVKWQREIVSALREISRIDESQLMISTHSIELLTQYSESVVSINPILNHKNLYVSEMGRDER